MSLEIIKELLEESPCVSDFQIGNTDKQEVILLLKNALEVAKLLIAFQESLAEIKKSYELKYERYLDDSIVDDSKKLLSLETIAALEYPAFANGILRNAEDISLFAREVYPKKLLDGFDSSLESLIDLSVKTAEIKVREIQQAIDYLTVEQEKLKTMKILENFV